MERGFNSDIQYKNQLFHVQTEDWGAENPFLVSRVFLNGAVLKTVRVAYSDLFSPRALRDDQFVKRAIVEELRRQHQEILDQLVSGQLL